MATPLNPENASKIGVFEETQAPPPTELLRGAPINLSRPLPSQTRSQITSTPIPFTLNPNANLGQPLPHQNRSQTGTTGSSPIAFTTLTRQTQPVPTWHDPQVNNPSTVSQTNTVAVEPNSFIGQIPHFLNSILSTPAGALPKGPLWVIVFEFDNDILNTIKNAKLYEPRMPVDSWEIDRALETVTTHRYQKEKGCMFAQSVTIPGDSLNYTQEGITYNSFIRGGVGLGRRDFDPLRINFLNTNVSFVDNVIRPWVIMTGHLGMIARPKEQKYRCNLTIYKLGIDRVDRPPFIAQQFNFWEVCPINVLAEELSYTAEGTSTTKTAEFVYQWYTTTSNKNTFALGGIEPTAEGIDIRRGIRNSVPEVPPKPSK